MTPKARQNQQQNICDLLPCIWLTGSSSTSLMTLLKRAAAHYECELAELTDDQIEGWLNREADRITQICAGSVLNG